MKFKLRHYPGRLVEQLYQLRAGVLHIADRFVHCQISKSLVRARLEQGHQFVSQAVVARARLDEWRMSLPGTKRRLSMSAPTAAVGGEADMARPG